MGRFVDLQADIIGNGRIWNYGHIVMHLELQIRLGSEAQSNHCWTGGCGCGGGAAAVPLECRV